MKFIVGEKYILKPEIIEFVKGKEIGERDSTSVANTHFNKQMIAVCEEPLEYKSPNVFDDKRYGHFYHPSFNFTWTYFLDNFIPYEGITEDEKLLNRLLKEAK